MSQTLMGQKEILKVGPKLLKMSSVQMLIGSDLKVFIGCDSIEQKCVTWSG